ncbi:uncharacterized protein LOC128603230 isoform X2 [Ictalurus furcatus]|uniref:uncharacterized protein LOC128603230 isoform X2 n=1 Tax=Ictalurus furcatus TaxID=66913 RepID=UPI0023503995|nr:uncharacterized protein LOC128603230 isoform X2 [Ictalurus furcatus]
MEVLNLKLLLKTSQLNEVYNNDLQQKYLTYYPVTLWKTFERIFNAGRERTGPEDRAGDHRKMAEIEIVPFAGSGRNHKPRFTLRIITEQKHASELVQMLTSQIRSTVGPSRSTDLGVSAVTAEVASTSQDQLEMYALSPCHTTTDAALPIGEEVTSLDLQTTNPTEHLVTATVEPIRITDNEENDSSDSETLQFYPALS